MLPDIEKSWKDKNAKIFFPKMVWKFQPESDLLMFVKVKQKFDYSHSNKTSSLDIRYPLSYEIDTESCNMYFAIIRLRSIWLIWFMDMSLISILFLIILDLSLIS